MSFKPAVAATRVGFYKTACFQPNLYDIDILLTSSLGIVIAHFPSMGSDDPPS